MQGARSRPRPRLFIPEHKHVEFVQSPNLTGGTLSPDLSPNSPPAFPTESSVETESSCLKVDNYILRNLIDTQGNVKHYDAIHALTQEEYLCKVVPIDGYQNHLNAYLRVGTHEHVSEIIEVIVGKTEVYLFFERYYGDLHTYVRSNKRLRESECCKLFAQIVSAVKHCHDNGLVLRDFKLRKFVFKDQEKTTLRLMGPDDAYILEDENNDQLLEKHGCPAYVSPEILTPNQSYSGRSADVWSLGVMLYTMLIGRYPFHDREPTALFSRIRRGDFCIPDSVSSRAKCLIRCLLRQNPTERLTAGEILQHPWFTSANGGRARAHAFALAAAANLGSGASAIHSKHEHGSKAAGDQTVPDIAPPPVPDFFI